MTSSRVHGAYMRTHVLTSQEGGVQGECALVRVFRQLRPMHIEHVYIHMCQHSGGGHNRGSTEGGERLPGLDMSPQTDYAKEEREARADTRSSMSSDGALRVKRAGRRIQAPPPDHPRLWGGRRCGYWRRGGAAVAMRRGLNGGNDGRGVEARQRSSDNPGRRDARGEAVCPGEVRVCPGFLSRIFQ